MFVGKKTFLHELSEFAFPILFPLLLYQRADNNSQAVGIDMPEGVEGHLGIPPGPRGVPVGWGSTVDPGRLEGQLWIPGSCRTTWGS